MSRDRESRHKAADNAIAITRMEGGEPSARARTMIEAWVDGYITSGEMLEMMREQAHGLSPKERE